MNFRKVLAESCIALELHSATKVGIMEELINLLVVAGRITDRQAAVSAVVERERKGSTGLQHGVAIPHGKTDSVDGLVAAFGIARNGVDFASHDGQPCKIIALTVSSMSKTGAHLEYLSEIGKILEKESVRERVLAARSASEVLDILSNGAT